VRTRITNAYIAGLKKKDVAYEVYDSTLSGFMVRVQPTGRKTFYVRYRLKNGKQTRKNLGRDGVCTPAQAREQAQKTLRAVAEGVDPTGINSNGETQTLLTFLDQTYLRHMQSTYRSGQSQVERIKTGFEPLLDRPLAKISPFDVDKTRIARSRKGISNATLNRDLSALKAALQRAVDWGVLDANPLSAVKRRKEDRSLTPRYLEDDEKERLFAALAAREERIRTERDSANRWRRDRGYKEFPDLREYEYADHLLPMVTVSLNTGLRRGELFSLNWADVDLKRKRITVRGHKAKSGTTRHLPLNSDVYQCLQNWRQQDIGNGLVFPGKDGGPFDNVNKSWRGILKDALIEGFRWHDMRHDFASRLVMAGVDLGSVRELLGHSDFKLTLRYAHLAPEHKAEAVERLVQKTVIKNHDNVDLRELTHQ